jgi:Domain of unknown function (DUF4091)/Family of unknown function (DUF6067)
MVSQRSQPREVTDDAASVEHQRILVDVRLANTLLRAATLPGLYAILFFAGSARAAVPASHITALWANEGGDKVAQDELRASRHVENKTGTVKNRAWDGTTIQLSGARNEVISFNLVLEAAQSAAPNIAVQFNLLTGPNNSKIQSKAATPAALFNWTDRPIELFYARYLEIKGLSYFGYTKDESQVPVRFRAAARQWMQRPDHDKRYPDPLVPLELVPTFTIAAGQNQSVWADIYIPKRTTPGVYEGAVKVLENGAVTKQIPVRLTVANFSLPDAPAAKTVVALDTTDIMWRYVGGHGNYTNWNTPGGAQIRKVTDAYFALFHRHKVSLVGENECAAPPDNPCDSAIPRLNGSLFTAANGYDGPGANTPNDVYSIGTYGTWGGAGYNSPAWKDNQPLFNQHIDRWVTWFESHLPKTDYFIYLQDEPGKGDLPNVEKWASWILNDPGPGKGLYSLATLDAGVARIRVPSLAIPVTHAAIGTCPNGNPCPHPGENLASVAAYYRSTPGKHFWMYNDGNPAVGTMNTEDDGIAPRTFGWAQWKMGVQRWFYWYANLNNNVDWFATATTWGTRSKMDPSLGAFGDNAPTNGNGLLIYPGTDVDHKANSYGIAGPIASLRLKEWRRGIQDADYLALANKIDPVATKSIVARVMPKALWENPSPGGDDPSYYIGPNSWSSNPDDWEAGRAQLSAIISSYCAKSPAAEVCR